MDEFRRKYESAPLIDTGSSCTYCVGKNPSGRIKCKICSEISNLMDIEDGWTDYIEVGTMKGKQLEIVEFPSISAKTAELSRKKYLQLDTLQKEKGQYFLRPYICMFKCGKDIFALRERMEPINPLKISLAVALSQLVEIFSPPESFPYSHMEPTTNCLMVKNVRHPVKKTIEGIEYETKDILQLDYGSLNLLNNFSLIEGGSKSGIILENDKYYYIRPGSEFESFIVEYPRFPLLGFHFFASSLLSLYDEVDRKKFADSLSGPIQSKTLDKAFLEMRGRKLRKDVLTAVIKDSKPMLEVVARKERFGNFAID